MQVADTQETATAATLGAQETVAFGMVEDAAFLMMLSTNLYSNQKLACIREPLCNAWDAHIEAGRTDTPINVTITPEYELVIEDSGNGIPDDKIGPIYGTYGASTKKNDGRQTGGFGLGCKSPFAYADSFRVISEHQGKGVIYNMSRASVEADGKPGITKVMELPTERSGLTVRFQLLEKDVKEMVEYIRTIALHGEMLINFTSADGEREMLPRLGMSAEPGTYSVEDRVWYREYMGKGRIFIRYGAVIYPILETPGTEKAVTLVRQFMEMVSFEYMLIQAAPGTLALTPSREALSSQRMTEDGITDLCVALVKRIEDDLIAQIPGSISKTIELLKQGDRSYCNLDSRRNVWDCITPTTVRRYLNCPLGAGKRAKYTRALEEAEQHGFKVQHTFSNQAATREYHKLRARMDGQSSYARKQDLLRAFTKHFVMRPLGKVMLANRTLLDQKHLQICMGSQYGGRELRDKSLNYYLGAGEFATLRLAVDKPVIVVTSRIKHVTDSIRNCPSLDRHHTVFLYKIVAGDKNREAIIKAFEDGGYTVIDLTLNHAWDTVAQRYLIERAMRTQGKQLPLVQSHRPKNLLLSLTNVYDEKGKSKTSNGALLLLKDSDETTDTPLFYLELDTFDRTGGMVGLFAHYTMLTDVERKHGVVVRNGTERNMAEKRGAVTADRYFAKPFIDAVLSPEYRKYVTQLRKPAVATDHLISSGDLKLFASLGIKLPGYEKLTFNPKFELLHKLLDKRNLAHVCSFTAMTQERKDQYLVARNYKLDKLPFIQKILAVKEDPILRRLAHDGSGISAWINKYPERKSALKSLVLCAIRNGNPK